jgi:hypothetical protein
VGLGLGWALRERQLQANVEAINGQGNVLEYFLIQRRYVVDWNEDRTMVTIFKPDEPNGGQALYVPAFNADPDPYTRR